MAEPAIIVKCGNPNCRRPLYATVVNGKQHILCGKCRTVTEVTFEQDEQEDAEE